MVEPAKNAPPEPATPDHADGAPAPAVGPEGQAAPPPRFTHAEPAPEPEAAVEPAHDAAVPVEPEAEARHAAPAAEPVHEPAPPAESEPSAAPEVVDQAADTSELVEPARTADAAESAAIEAAQDDLSEQPPALAAIEPVAATVAPTVRPHVEPRPFTPRTAEKAAPELALGEDKILPLTVYVMYLAGLLTFGVSAVVGVILAYMNERRAPAWLRSHYVFQIRTFWIAIAMGVAGGVTATVGVGLVLLLFLAIWFVVRAVAGLNSLLKNQPYPRPRSWWL